MLATGPAVQDGVVSSELALIGSSAATPGAGTASAQSGKPSAGEKAQSSAADLATAPVSADASQSGKPEPLAQALAKLDLVATPARAPLEPALLTVAPPPPPDLPKELSQALAKPLPMHAVPMEIGLRALQGAREFQIRLDPAELGRVDVKLSIDKDSTVTARIVVDRVETLHLLQREAKTLERAFEQAGLKSSDGAVDVSLRDHNGQSGRQATPWDLDAGSQGHAAISRSSAVIDTTPAPRRAVHAGALDLSI